MKINSIKKGTGELTVDIEVENTHSYQLGNGAVSHNSVSKLFGLTEGAHLPAMQYYLRWVQFRSDDPLVEQYKADGYPTKELESYEGTTIVGFPTQPVISTLGMKKKLVTAAQATPEEQFQWLMLLEKYWLLNDDMGNQISYTLKYDPEVVSLEELTEVIKKYQPLVRCVSIMPQADTTAFEYLPEEIVSEKVYNDTVSKIQSNMTEDVGSEHVQCEGGACPIDFEG